VEFAFALPLQQKIYHATSKMVLRQALQGVLPEVVRTRRSKLGYSTPERAWLNGTLGDLLRELVHSESFKDRGYFDLPGIERALDEHQHNQRDLSGVAWRWINLELWSRQMIDSDPVALGSV
jgi:asparagine synthase (glutamine-hydrolysing)